LHTLAHANNDNVIKQIALNLLWNSRAILLDLIRNGTVLVVHWSKTAVVSVKRVVNVGLPSQNSHNLQCYQCSPRRSHCQTIRNSPWLFESVKMTIKVYVLWDKLVHLTHSVRLLDKILEPEVLHRRHQGLMCADPHKLSTVAIWVYLGVMHGVHHKPGVMHGVLHKPGVMHGVHHKPGVMHEVHHEPLVTAAVWKCRAFMRAVHPKPLLCGVVLNVLWIMVGNSPIAALVVVHVPL